MEDALAMMELAAEVTAALSAAAEGDEANNGEPEAARNHTPGLVLSR
jgi:hypothetical protein